MLWPSCCECQASSRGGPVQESSEIAYQGRRQTRLYGVRVPSGTNLRRCLVTVRQAEICGSSVARPSAAGADSLGYRAAQASPPLRPPWPFSRALRAAQARRAGALGVFPRKIHFPVAWMADLGREPERAASMIPS